MATQGKLNAKNLELLETDYEENENPYERAPFSPSAKSDHETAQEAAKVMKHTEAGAWTIAPDKNKHVQNWDVVLCFALVYTAVVTPAEVGFVHDTKKVNEYKKLLRKEVRS